MKGYVEDLLRSGRIRRSKSPFGASLFFVKNKGSLHAVVDYRALYPIKKRNITILPRADEMFDRLGKGIVFSKLDLKKPVSTRYVSGQRISRKPLLIPNMGNLNSL